MAQKNWAIAIGINQYELLPSSAHLRYAVRDAELMRDFLDKTAGFPQKNILLCSDNSSSIGYLSTRPSRSNLRRLLREELQQARGADNLWFFFAGHGMAGQNGDYFLPIDGNPNDLEETAVSVHFVTECLRRCHAKNVVLVLDMCRNEGRTNSRDISENVGEQTIELARQQGIITMFSCSRGERSYEIPALEQGAFTYCLVNGLKQHTILRQLERYLTQEIPELSKKYAKNIPIPRIVPEPGWKYDAPLLPGYATQLDVNQLVQQATDAELEEEFEKARDLWWQIIEAGSQSERTRARTAIERIRRKEIARTPIAPPTSSPEPSASRSPINPTPPPTKTASVSDIDRDVGIPPSLNPPNTPPPPLTEIPFTSRLIPPSPAPSRTRTVPKPSPAPSRQPPSPQTPIFTPHSRRQVLKWAGLGSGGLLLTVLGRQFLGDSPSPPAVTQIPLPSGTSPTSLHLLKLPDTVRVNNQGEQVETIPVQANVYEENLGNGITLRMAEIPRGTFMMGSPDSELERADDEGPQREVSVPGFFMGMFAVTQAQYEAVMDENPATQYDRDRFVDPNKPVVGVSWNEAIAFCERLSELTGREYRLPSEAEWEYACRAGTETPFYFGETITTDLANYDGNYTYGSGPKGEYREKPMPVGSFPANAFGLFDMHGNVWEWCLDHWHENYEGAPTDGSAWIEGGDSARRLIRGGSWFNNPINCRSAFRIRISPGVLDDLVGFRVVSVSA